MTVNHQLCVFVTASLLHNSQLLLGKEMNEKNESQMSIKTCFLISGFDIHHNLCMQTSE